MSRVRIISVFYIAETGHLFTLNQWQPVQVLVGGLGLNALQDYCQNIVEVTKNVFHGKSPIEIIDLVMIPVSRIIILSVLVQAKENGYNLENSAYFGSASLILPEGV